MNEIVLDDEDDNDDIDNVDVVYLQREHHLGVSRAFVAAVRRQLQRDFSRQRLLTIALNVQQSFRTNPIALSHLFLTVGFRRLRTRHCAGRRRT